MNVNPDVHSEHARYAAWFGSLEPPAPEGPLSLEQLIERYSTEVGGLLRRCGVAPADVDDVRQRVWLTVARSLVRIRRGSERAFLCRVARGEASHMRRTYRRRSEILADTDAGPARELAADDLLAWREQVAALEAALLGLEEGLRRILVRIELDEVPIAAIAAELGLPLGTVKSRLRRARAKLNRHRSR